MLVKDIVVLAVAEIWQYAHFFDLLFNVDQFTEPSLG